MMAYRRKTKEEISWLVENIPNMGAYQVLDKFEDMFGWRMTYNSLCQFRQSFGVKSARISMNTKHGTYSHMWTKEHDDWLREHVPGTPWKKVGAMFNERFGCDLSWKSINSHCKTIGLINGRNTRFEKGHVSNNKGKTWDEMGMSKESQARSLATCFKKGNIPWGTKPVGFERVSKDGYIEVKVKNGLQDKANDNFEFKHRVIWEQAHGPIPEGHNVVFADGNNRNFNLENLVLVSRKDWGTMMVRKIDFCNADTLKVACATAKLHRNIAEIKRCERRAKTVQSKGE